MFAGKDRDVGEVLVKSLQNTKYSINEKLENSFINFFGQKPKVSSEALPDAQGTDKDVEQDGKIETLDNNEMDLDGSESSDQEEADAMSDSEAYGSDDDGDATGSKGTNGDRLKEQIEFHNGRRRRRAIFGNDVDKSDLMVSLKLLCLCLQE